MNMKKLVLDPSSPLPLKDVVYETLRSAILKGELKPDVRLMEIHLADELGVSRTPVRQAVRMLEKEGLAVIYPRRGALVAHMSVKDLKDVIEMRIALDVLAAKKACENSDIDVIRKLEEEVVAFEEAMKTDDIRKIVEEDESFHNIIYDCAANPKLKEALIGLREQMYRYRFKYIKEKSMMSTLIDEHKQILEAIKNRDKNAVTEAMTIHLKNQYETVKQLIETDTD